MKLRLTIAVALSTLAIAPLAAQTAANMATRERGFVAAMKSDLRLLATAEEAYFMDSNGTYYSGTVSASNPLVGFKPAPNVTINVVATDNGHQWTATASHALTQTKCTYHLPDPIVCDPPLPSDSSFATPRGSSTDAGFAGSRTIKIDKPDSAIVRATRSRSWPFDVRPPQTRCTVTGQVVAQSGGDKKVVVLLMTEFAYEDWIKNRPARTYFESAPRTEIPFDIRIEGEGRYRLVVWNQSAHGAPKLVQLQQTQVDCQE